MTENWIVTVPILVIIIVLAIVKMDKQEEVNAARAEPGKAQRAECIDHVQQTGYRL